MFYFYTGFENEGWFDPWSLLKAFKEKALSLGAQYINGEVNGFGCVQVPRQGAEMANYTGSGRRVKTVKVGCIHFIIVAFVFLNNLRENFNP